MKYFYCLLIFLAGMTVANNLTLLVGFNPDYVAEWWKVGLSISAAIVISLYLKTTEGD